MQQNISTSPIKTAWKWKQQEITDIAHDVHSAAVKDDHLHRQVILIITAPLPAPRLLLLSPLKFVPYNQRCTMELHCHWVLSLSLCGVLAGENVQSWHCYSFWLLHRFPGIASSNRQEALMHKMCGGLRRFHSLRQRVPVAHPAALNESMLASELQHLCLSAEPFLRSCGSVSWTSWAEDDFSAEEFPNCFSCCFSVQQRSCSQETSLTVSWHFIQPPGLNADGYLLLWQPMHCL